MPLTPLEEQQIVLYERAELLLKARESFSCWCRGLGYMPQRHHDFIISKLQEVADSDQPRHVIILMPPGTAKSTYSSKLFPPWYLGRRPGYSILACSHSKDLAEDFGRASRNLVTTHTTELGFTLAGDSKAADAWETTTGGKYFCAGVGTGIAGYRADLGLIDDYLKNQEDADSAPIRAKQWSWFVNDFWPRTSGTQSTNDGSIVIIANRRHEEDLVGRLIDPTNKFESPIDPAAWEVIKIPFFATENDPLGRAVGEVIWPEKFAHRAAGVMKLPSRERAGLYQQEPRATDGSYFKLPWLTGYEPQDLPKNLTIYNGSDFACSDKSENTKRDSTCLLFGGWDGSNLWILPSIFWEKADAGKIVEALLALCSKHDPLTWWAEKGHISKCLGPFISKIGRESGIYPRITEVVPHRDKTVRARSAQGMAEYRRIMFPKFAEWWPRAEDELLTFPGGGHDDFVDALAHLCKGINAMIKPSPPEGEDRSANMGGKFRLTGSDLSSLLSGERRALQIAEEDR